VKLPIALNCWEVFLAIVGVSGWIASDTSVAGVTVREVDPDTPFTVAVITEVTVVAVAATATAPSGRGC
jgi:hypothetical protein